MFEVFRKRAPKKPQISSQYPLFSDSCLIGITSVYAEQSAQADKDANVCVLSDGNIIVYDKKSEKMLLFFSAKEIRKANKDVPQSEQSASVLLLTGQKKIVFSFASQEQKNIFLRVIEYVREKAV